MKPPGGESRDIFGADFNGSPSHHRVLKPPGGGTSDLFSSTGKGPKGDTGRRVRNLQPNSQLPLGALEDPLPTPAPTKAHNHHSPDGNPVTGEGYQLQDGEGKVAVTPGGSSTSGSEAGSEGKTQRTRVPPGGFSSGFW